MSEGLDDDDDDDDDDDEYRRPVKQLWPAAGGRGGGRRSPIGGRRSPMIWRPPGGNSPQLAGGAPLGSGTEGMGSGRRYRMVKGRVGEEVYGVKAPPPSWRQIPALLCLAPHPLLILLLPQLYRPWGEDGEGPPGGRAGGAWRRAGRPLRGRAFL